MSLFNYQVDLASPLVAQKSWASLLTRNVADALNVPGFTLMAGSGVTDQLQRSSTIKFNFFDLYKYSSVHNFFDNCTAELSDDGSIAISFDTGIEADVTTNGAMDKMKVYFSATATDDTKANVNAAAIDLHIEISEKGDSAGATTLAAMFGMIAQGKPSLQSTYASMSLYAQANPGTLSLNTILKQSAFKQLIYSHYVDNKPLPRSQQTDDQGNWNAMQIAATNLMNLPYVAPWTWDDWATFNSCCNSGDPNGTPDRRDDGNWANPQNLPTNFWKGYEQDWIPFINYFLRALAHGMNLFEDAVTLANDFATVTTDEQLKVIENRVKSIVKGDFNIDYSKSIVTALITRVTEAGAQVAVSSMQAADSSSYTTTLTFS